MRADQICRGRPLLMHSFYCRCINKKMSDRENNENQSDGARHPQRCSSMANIKIYKRHYIFLRQSLPFYRFPAFQIFYLENLCKDCAVQHLQWWHSTAIINVYESRSKRFALIVFEILAFQMFDLENCDRHWVQHSQWCQSVNGWRKSTSIKVKPRISTLTLIVFEYTIYATMLFADKYRRL